MNRLLLILVALAVLLGNTSPAHAGSYDVILCSPAGTAGTAWSPQVSTASIQTSTDLCSIAVATIPGAPLMSYGDSGAWQLSVPEPLRITAVKRFMLANTYLNEWLAFTESDVGEVDHCRAGDGSAGSSTTACSRTYQDENAVALTSPAHWLRIGIRCVTSQCFAGGAVSSANVRISDVSATVTDAQAPSAAVGGVPAAVSAGGAISVAVSGSDQTGIARLELVVDGRVVAVSTRICDFSRVLPCESPGGTVSAQLTATGLAPGKHQVVGRAVDAAGNVGSSDSPASPPATVTVPGGPGATPAPGASGTPGQSPGGSPGSPQSGSLAALGLKVTSVRRHGSRVRVRGSVAAGCSSKLLVRVSVAGRKRTAHVKPSRSGRWGVWSSGLRRDGKISVRVSAPSSSACVAGAVRTSRR